jgi:Methyltransferase domain
MKNDQWPSFRKIPPNSVCVEIGTWEGDYSWEILKNTTCKKLYCVDPYRRFPNGEYPDAMNTLTQEQFDEKFNTVKQRFAQFGDRVEFLRMTSSEAVSMFVNESLDFVYIDGNHDYKFVLNDIMLWYPKVKIGGYLTGDDVYSTDPAEHGKDGNVQRNWGGPIWSKYGTYTAVVEGKRRLGYEFEIDQTQFIIQKHE